MLFRSALGEARPGQSSLSAGALRYRAWAHSSILAWEIPWTEEPGGLQSMRSAETKINKATMKGSLAGPHMTSSGAWSAVQRLWWKQVKGKESSSWQQCFGERRVPAP